MNLIHQLRLFFIKYKKEIIFSFGMALICFSIAIWAIVMNYIKLDNIDVIGSY